MIAAHAAAELLAAERQRDTRFYEIVIKMFVGVAI